MLLRFILCVFTFSFTMTFQGGTSNAIMNSIAKPGCQKQCGDITVPYPFGIGKDTRCSLNDEFFVTCSMSEKDKPPKLFLRSSNYEILDISDLELRVKTYVSYTCYKNDGAVDGAYSWQFSLRSFSFSEKNKFTVIGCDDYGLITDEKEDKFSSGCIGLCSKALVVPDEQCSGKGCCQTSIPKGLQFYKVKLNTFWNHTDVWSFNRCGYAFLGEEGKFGFRGGRDLSNNSEVVERIESTTPIVITWVIVSDQNCSKATECKENSSCYDVDGGGYRCKCKKGYRGNPYLDHGCQDIDECKDQRNSTCYGVCINTPGSYNCTCPQGTYGDPKLPNGCETVANVSKKSETLLPVDAVIVSGLLLILLGVMGICSGLRRRKLTRLREKFFEQNGGMLLKQKLISQGSHEAMTLFSPEQLQKATNNYSHEKIIGRGAYGVVYKGVLSDKRVVAIKKSKLVDQSQAEQFINEVMILTQVIHRNVVKLLGCCLEEDVPVLVYEFISNNTLFHHIHHKLGGMSWLSWENRLRVAAEAASALGYLHSETSMPIIHRDVKSSNILLDENYTTKISDFGASRLVPLDHNQVSTLIMGTLGYLDPEYFHTSQLTDKSDVYSFGVVLAELITGKKTY